MKAYKTVNQLLIGVVGGSVAEKAQAWTDQTLAYVEVAFQDSRLSKLDGSTLPLRVELAAAVKVLLEHEYAERLPFVSEASFSLVELPDGESATIHMTLRRRKAGV